MLDNKKAKILEFWNSYSLLRKVLSGLFLTLPIIIFCFGLLVTGSKLAPGDADYLIQTSEAMRRSILEFRQFPWWNPWVSGGVPLFANPQFGLVSIQTPFVLIFGTLLGYKLALVSYFIVGFWGFRQLFIRALKTPVMTATMLAYIWTFGTFLTQRMSGHHTFLVIQLFPWALLIYLQRNSISHAWLKFGLLISFMTLSAAHNMTVMSYFVLALIIILHSGKYISRVRQDYVVLQIRIIRKDIYFWLKVAGIFVLLTSYRLFFTMQYLKDFPRVELLNMEQTIGPVNAVFAIFGPLRQFANAPVIPSWSWLEASAYISIFTLPAAIIIFAVFIRQRKNWSKYFSISPFILLVLFVVFFLLSLGDFMGVFSPYSLLRMLPVFSSMRVAVRWLAWCSVIVLFFIAAYKGNRYRKVVNALLALAVVELFFYTRPYLAKPYFINFQPTRPSSSTFEQKRLYNTQRFGVSYDENLTEATRSNYGQIIAGDALVDTRFPAPWGDPTRRCSIDEGCALVMSKNALVTYWSPNKIILKRTGSGDIKLNTNPGKGWTVNNTYVFLDMKVVDADSDFTITNKSEVLTLEYRPRLSIDWALHKILN